MAAIFADYIFKCILVDVTFCVLIEISLKLVSKGSVDNTPALVLIMAWRRIGDKPLSEPVLIQFTDAYMRHLGGDELIRAPYTRIVVIWHIRKHTPHDFAESN